MNDLAHSVRQSGERVSLPFDADQVVQSMRGEAYAPALYREGSTKPLLRSLYYAARPVLPVGVRKYVQKLNARGWRRNPFPRWPVDTSVDDLMSKLLLLTLRSQRLSRIPFIWFWPDGASACALMTHDVETAQGRDFCSQLMDINDRFNIKASFQVVPESRYEVGRQYLESITSRGFEVNVQDLNHDGCLYNSLAEFTERSVKINRYRQEFKAEGFRAAVLYRRQEWFDYLNFAYDMSVPNVGHLDPQHGGCCTVMPYFVGNMLELPVTTTQDYMLFHLLQNYSLDLWKEQVRILLDRHGLMTFIVHPDYITEKAEQKLYCDLLAYMSELRSRHGVWIPLPREANEWWRQRDSMRLVQAKSGEWKIEGQGSERARLAWASEHEGKLKLSIEPHSAPVETAGKRPRPRPVSLPHDEVQA